MHRPLAWMSGSSLPLNFVAALPVTPVAESVVCRIPGGKPLARRTRACALQHHSGRFVRLERTHALGRQHLSTLAAFGFGSGQRPPARSRVACRGCSGERAVDVCDTKTSRAWLEHLDEQLCCAQIAAHTSRMRCRPTESCAEGDREDHPAPRVWHASMAGCLPSSVVVVVPSFSQLAPQLRKR